MRKLGAVALTESQRNHRFYERHKDAELARNKAYYPAYYEKNRQTIKDKRRNARHRITQEWFESTRAAQDFKCAICREPFIDTPHIDHDHRCCGQLTSCDQCRRGLLCKDCNLGLGRFKDSIVLLANAIQYLEKHNESRSE